MSYWAISHVTMQTICTKALFYTLVVFLQNVGINKKLYSQVKKKKKYIYIYISTNANKAATGQLD